MCRMIDPYCCVKVVWIDNQENPPKLLAFEDSSPVLLTIERVDTMEPTVSSISFDNRWCIQPAHLESINMLWRRHRFWLRGDRQVISLLKWFSVLKSFNLTLTVNTGTGGGSAPIL